MKIDVINVDPQILGGTPVFKGTREQVIQGTGIGGAIILFRED